MSEEILAKPVVDDSFWILEKDGARVGIMHRIENHYQVIDKNKVSFDYKNIDTLKSNLNIRFIKGGKEESIPADENEIHGFPIPADASNKIYDVRRKLPLFTKNPKSKSFYCAGYYLVKFENRWAKAYCPKLITLQRYPYQGPYKTSTEQNEQFKALIKD